MAYVIVNDFEGGTREQYDATTAVVHPAGGLPAGQTHHYAGPSANGWVVVAVWESKAIWEKFRDETPPTLQPTTIAGEASKGIQQRGRVTGVFCEPSARCG